MPAFSHTLANGRRHLYSVVRGPWRLILDESSGEVSLYDRRTDPAEKFDVARQQPERVEELRALLEAQRERDRALGQRFQAEAPEGMITEEIRRELRALGYLDEEP